MGKSLGNERGKNNNTNSIKTSEGYIHIMRFLIWMIMTIQTFGFKSQFTNMKKTISIKVSVNPMDFEGVIARKSVTDLLGDIESENADKIFLSDDLKKTYIRNDINHDGEYDIEDYSIVNTDPAIANMILEKANGKHIQTVILEPYKSSLDIVMGTLYGAFNLLFYPTIIYIILRSVFNGVFGGGGTPGPMMGAGFRGVNDVNSDKLNMIKSNISLASWAGSPEIFQECNEVVTYLNNRTLYQAAGAEIPRGILLEGPPGTGKTLIAKAIASECDANFISIAASEFVELFVGMGASKVRNLFEKARKNSPCIVFIDEIDAVGKQRGTGINVGNDEREQTLNQLLAEMDGFAQNDNVLVIAATNRRDVLDNALLRPGRFDRIINVPLPDSNSRKSILNVHMRNKTIDADVNINSIIDLTAGYSGAELKNLVNEAAINAVRENSTIITDMNIRDALEKLTVGLIKQNDTRSEAAKLRVARHELGHAFLAAYFSEYFLLKKVSIQSTYNGAGGYTLFNEYPEVTESGLYTKDMLMKRIIVALGGKAAEYVFYGDNHISLGAQQDLKQANSIAKQMIGNYGMGDVLKTFYNENSDNARNPFLGKTLATNSGVYSESIKQMFDKETRQIVDHAYNEAVHLINNNQQKINVLSNILLNVATLDGPFVDNYLTGNFERTEDSY